MAESRDVVITGLGIVSPIGIGKDAFWSSLREGRSGVAEREIYNGFDTPYRIAAEVRDFDPKQFVKPRKSLKVMCREIQFACAAGAMAMEDAALSPGDYDPDRTGVVVGSQLFHCKLEELEEAYRNCLSEGIFRPEDWGHRAMSDIFPLWMLKHLPNMPACHIGISIDARGHNNTIVSAGVSSLTAVAESVDVIRRGWADVMLAGGTGSEVQLTTGVYRGDRELARPTENPAAASRPFDASRNGHVAGEGSAVYVLERREHAEARGATIYARVLGSGSSCETASAQPGQGIRNAIAAALRSAQLSASDIGHVNANARSVVAEDAIEAKAIRDTFGDVSVTAPKSFFGYLGPGSGAVEMAASVLSLASGEVPMTLNYDTPDPECPVNVVHGQPASTEQRTAIVLNHSHSGQAAAIALGEV